MFVNKVKLNKISLQKNTNIKQSDAAIIGFNDKQLYTYVRTRQNDVSLFNFVFLNNLNM